MGKPIRRSRTIDELIIETILDAFPEEIRKRVSYPAAGSQSDYREFTIDHMPDGASFWRLPAITVECRDGILIVCNGPGPRHDHKYELARPGSVEQALEFIDQCTHRLLNPDPNFGEFLDSLLHDR